MDVEQIERRDKREMAIHEAGHATVAAALGKRVSAWLVKTETEDVIGEKTWIGHAQLVGDTFDAQIAVAGIVAELLDEIADIDKYEIVGYWDDEAVMPSPADLQFVPDDREDRSR